MSKIVAKADLEVRVDKRRDIRKYWHNYLEIEKEWWIEKIELDNNFEYYRFPFSLEIGENEMVDIEF